MEDCEDDNRIFYCLADEDGSERFSSIEEVFKHLNMVPGQRVRVGFDSGGESWTGYAIYEAVTTVDEFFRCPACKGRGEVAEGVQSPFERFWGQRTEDETRPKITCMTCHGDNIQAWIVQYE